MRNHRKELKQLLQGHPELVLTTYAPGDGYTRHRLHYRKLDELEPTIIDYFSGDELFTGTARECVVFIYGYRTRNSIMLERK